MVSLPGIIFSELVYRQPVARVPEPEAVMDDVNHVAGYTCAGREVDVMAPTHLFHTAQACDLIRPGDRVLDLGCGPGTQLVQLALLHRDATFMGIDLSRPMLAEGRSYAAARGAENVAFVRGDITRLDDVADQSIDVVLSSMTLHHLPQQRMLSACFAAIRRVLKPDGGIYLADFLRLHREQSMRYFAYQHADRQPPSFTQDYFNSLRAAFSTEEYRTAMVRLSEGVRFYRTWPLPLFMVLRTPPRRALDDPALIAGLRSTMLALSDAAKDDLRTIQRLFRAGGLRTQAIG